MFTDDSFLYTDIPCVSAETLFKTTIGNIRIDQLTDKSIVFTEKGVSKILKIIKIPYSGRLYTLKDVRISSLYTHFIEYLFLDDISSYYTGFVYNVILENRDCMKSSEDVYVASWGNNLPKNNYSHDYFDSENIVTDIFSVAKDFIVELDKNSFLIDSESGLVCSLNIQYIIENKNEIHFEDKKYFIKTIIGYLSKICFEFFKNTNDETKIDEKIDNIPIYVEMGIMDDIRMLNVKKSAFSKIADKNNDKFFIPRVIPISDIV